MPDNGIKRFVLTTIGLLVMALPAQAQEGAYVPAAPEIAPTTPADGNAAPLPWAQPEASTQQPVPAAQPMPEMQPLTEAQPAPTQAAQEKPLMVIRFTKPAVRYHNTLSYAVVKARTANPQVRFRILSYAPEGNTRTQTERNLAKAKDNVTAIVNEIIGLGVAPEQVFTNMQTDPALEYQEVHIFLE